MFSCMRPVRISCASVVESLQTTFASLTEIGTGILTGTARFSLTSLAVLIGVVVASSTTCLTEGTGIGRSWSNAKSAAIGILKTTRTWTEATGSFGTTVVTISPLSYFEPAEDREPWERTPRMMRIFAALL